MPKVFSPKIKELAHKLYLEGQSAADISAAIQKKHKSQVGVSTIYQWVQANDWKVSKAVARTASLEQLQESETLRFHRIQQEHLDVYGKLRTKAATELDMLQFDRAFDAAKALDVGIKGERNVIEGLINLHFIQEIMGVLVEEIQDRDILARIAVRLKTVMIAGADNE
jgi:hypothetical protein|tara:strand:+ start:572 stop:1075 length:504 start_codon:yes stop_codon:yes gene_type:complete